MKFLDEFRDSELAQRLLRQIRKKATRRWVIMEVCGGQTHSLLRHGIDTELQDVVELIHGPGCPVCVTDIGAIDRAQQMAMLPGVMLASFGDMLRVPGTQGSLLTRRAAGARVMTVYSPLDAVEYAQQNPREQVVLFAVGFETTIPSTALAVMQAERLGLANFSVLVSHVRVMPAMESLMQAGDSRVQGFLAAGHVCVVTGCGLYDDFVRRHRMPVVVTGFEPVDLLQGILACVTQLEDGRCQVENCYGRTVNRNGNPNAQHLVESVYEVADQTWRGFGVIPAGGYRLKPEYEHLDAQKRFRDAIRNEWSDELIDEQTATNGESLQRCRAGLVMSGQLRPCDCPEFGKACTPDSPLGSPMVSSEGACAAYFRYRVPTGPDLPETAVQYGGTL